MRKSTVCGLVMLTFLALAQGCDRSEQADDPGKKPRQPPEAVIRLFLLATMKRDQATLKRICMPHDDLSALWSDKLRSSKDLEQIEKSVASAKIRILKVGDEMILGGIRKLVMDSELVNEKRIQLTIDGKPAFFDLHLVSGQWKVDAHIIIASTKMKIRWQEMEDARRDRAK